MSEVSALSAEVARIAGDVLANGEIEKIMQEKIKAGIEDAIESAFRYGDLRDAIKNRVREVLVPYIERYDMGDYVVKLDGVLSEIVEQSAIADNRKLLENFKGLMVERQESKISIEDLFDRYCDFVGKNVDVFELEVNLDDEPTYEPVTALAEVVEDDRPQYFESAFKYANLFLHVEGSDELGFNVRLSKWEGDREDGYDISYDVAPSMPGLCDLSDFEVLLCSLQRARVKLVCDRVCLKEYVEPDRKPEAQYE